jgi:tripartite-type tricarboxylate transporter receptor subunit TctC
MRKSTAVVLSLLIIAIVFSGCYFSVGLLARLGETTWEYAVTLDSTVEATGTIAFDKRSNFTTLNGTLTQVSPNPTTVVFTGSVDNQRNITINTIKISATEAVKFDGTVNEANTLIKGTQLYASDTTATPTQWYQGTWTATKTSK